MHLYARLPFIIVQSLLYSKPNHFQAQVHCIWQILINVVANHRWRLTRKAFLGGSAPPDPPNSSAAVAASEGQEGPMVIALVGRCRSVTAV